MEVLNALQPDRKEGCPSDLTLTLYETDSLDPQPRAEVEAHLSTCSRCQGVHTSARADFEAIAPEVRAELVQKMLQAQPEPHRSRGPRGWMAGLVAAAATLAIYVAAPGDQPAGVRMKGGDLGLQVFRERAGVVTRAMSQDGFAPKDHLRFEVDLPEAGHVLVFGVEAGGATYRAFPNDRDGSEPLPGGSGQLLPDAIELDASEGPEALHLVLCAQPFTISEVFATGIKLPKGCRSTSFAFKKAGP